MAARPADGRISILASPTERRPETTQLRCQAAMRLMSIAGTELGYHSWLEQWAEGDTMECPPSRCAPRRVPHIGRRHAARFFSCGCEPGRSSGRHRSSCSAQSRRFPASRLSFSRQEVRGENDGRRIDALSASPMWERHESGHRRLNAGQGRSHPSLDRPKPRWERRLLCIPTATNPKENAQLIAANAAIGEARSGRSSSTSTTSCSGIRCWSKVEVRKGQSELAAQGNLRPWTKPYLPEIVTRVTCPTSKQPFGPAHPRVSLSGRRAWSG